MTDPNQSAENTSSKDPSASHELDRVYTIGQYTIKAAETPEEFDQLNRLNHKTFVQELGQYDDSGSNVLVDKFHNRNRYFIALHERRVVGMISVHDKAPFSIEKRLDNPAIIEELGPRPLEVRLLALDPEHRHRRVSLGLTWSVYRFAKDHGYKPLLISGISKRVAMYKRVGFLPLGPAKRSGNADYVPMWTTPQMMREHQQGFHDSIKKRGWSEGEAWTSAAQETETGGTK